MNFSITALRRQKNLENIKKNLGFAPRDDAIDTMPPTERFRLLCEANMTYIRNLTLPKITKNNLHEAILIEHRCLPHIEYLLRNTIIKLGDKWSHTVVCGNINYNFMVTLCATISPEISVIKMDYDDLSPAAYNLMLSNSYFWELFSGEKLLLYPENSYIFKSNVDDFLKWDYIGSPHSFDPINPVNCIFSGKFSLRTKQCMIDVISRVSINDTILSSSATAYMQHSGLDICPEDIYFSTNILRFGLGRVAEWDTSIAFSTASSYSGDSFGGYNFWTSDEKWKSRVQLLRYITPYTNPSILSESYPDFQYSEHSFIHYDDVIQNLPRRKHNPREKISIDLIHSCILIIDFCNKGGGVSVFMESIIRKYAKHQTFLLTRNFNGHIFFTINDDYELESSYTENDAFVFLLNNRNKIEKIFVNHTEGHSTTFIQNLFSLEKQLTTITHDLNLLFTTPVISFDDVEKYTSSSSLRNNVDINNYHQIITQNIANLYLYNNYIQDKSKIIITPLPDFKNAQDMIRTSNHNVVIGIIGGIYDLKGKVELEKIIRYYKNTNVRVIVFGTVNIPSFTDIYPYNTIHDLNRLFTIHKPNALLELSICGETYSYTLTIAMITQLPILYLKKHGMTVIENRLSQYNNAFSFTTIGELNMLVNQKKQNYFYTVAPTIYFNAWWDAYFLPVTTPETCTIIDAYRNKNLVLITSKIIVSKNSFSYAQSRSKYSTQQRFVQTIKTIASVRKYIPDSYVVLIDNSEFNNLEYAILKYTTDYFINIIDDKELNYNTNEHKLKLIAELSQQLCFYDNFLKKIDINTITHFFKISGRYFINEDFNYNKYNNALNIFKKNSQIRGCDHYYYTSFYKLNPSILVDYFEKLKIILADKDSYIETPKHHFEAIVPQAVQYKNLILTLGITQLVSVVDTVDNI